MTLTVSVLAQSDEPMTILSGVVPIIIMVFLRIYTDIGSKYTDISVRNTEHNFTRLEALKVDGLDKM